jgi:carbamoylphosphate synthase large subunit
VLFFPAKRVAGKSSGHCHSFYATFVSAHRSERVVIIPIRRYWAFISLLRIVYCYDKSLVRGVAQEMGIPVPYGFIIKAEDINFIEIQMEFPVIVKPNFGDSSFGITRNSVCYNVMDLENALLQVRQQVGYDKPVLVEKFLTGKQDYRVKMGEQQ